MRKGIWMEKIPFKEFELIMSRDLLANMPENYDISELASYKIGPCIEIEFCVDNDKEYQECWMGKMIKKDTKENVYWFGLTEDGNQAYDYNSLQKFTNAKVFYGTTSLKEIWSLVTLICIKCYDGVQEQLLCHCTNQKCEDCEE